MRPAPPVANSVAFAWRMQHLAGLHLERRDAEHRAVLRSRIRSSAIHSTKNWVLARTFCWYSVCSMAWPVRSAAAQARIAILALP